MGLNRDANLAMLAVIADRLGTLREKMVFLGGCTTGLLVTDSGAPDVRATMDVDMIVEVSSSLDFHTIEAAMRDRGFKPDTLSGIRCRWRSGDIIVDLMPDNEKILGFSNRWYGDAIDHAVKERLGSDCVIKRVTAPYFIATKIEAFNGRGNGDYVRSHDFEDIATVIDGREELRDEVAASEPTLRRYIGCIFSEWMANHDLHNALAGQNPNDHGRYELLERRFRAIASID